MRFRDDRRDTGTQYISQHRVDFSLGHAHASSQALFGTPQDKVLAHIRDWRPTFSVGAFSGLHSMVRPCEARPSRSFGTGSAVQPFSYAGREAHTNASRSWPYQEHHAASCLASTSATHITTALGVLRGDPRTMPLRSRVHYSFWVPPLASHQGRFGPYRSRTMPLAVEGPFSS